MKIEPLTESEISAGLTAKLCADGRVRLAQIGFVGRGEDATAALCWYLPRTREDRFKANKFRATIKR